MFALHYTGQEEKEQAEAVFGSGRSIILSEDRMKQAGLSPGDTIRLSDGASERITPWQEALNQGQPTWRR